MMRLLRVRIILPLIVLLAASLACDLPASSGDEENLPATETMQALATIVAGTLEPVDGEGESSESEEPEAAEDSAAEASITPTSSVTPTQGAPMVSVSVDTNCRFGPGEVYEYQGALLVGEQAGIAGKLADESFWYIENPDAPPPFCWVWGAYAQVQGDTSGVAILTPPPTPTPEYTPTATLVPISFEASEYDVTQCVHYTFITKVKNTGSVPIESYSISIAHPHEGLTLVNTQDYFANDPICGSTNVDSIPAGGTEFIVLDGFQSFIGVFQVTLKVCSEEGLGGVCEVTYFEAYTV
jgi:hypothetical protein